MAKETILEGQNTVDVSEAAFDDAAIPAAESEKLEQGIDTGETKLEADVEEIVSEKELDEDEAESEASGEDRSDTEPVISQRTRRNRRTVEDERARQLAAEQSAIANESALRSAIRSNRVFTEKVAAVEEISVGNESVIAAIVILEKVFKVIIPFNELFTNNPIDTSTVNLDTSDGRYNYMRRTRQFAERMIGGTIPFCITAAERDGNNVIMLGSRARAMERQSRLFFGGDNPRYKAGDTVEVTLTSVNVHSVVALVGGVDVVIPQHRLTRRWLLDLHDGYKVGDTILAVITDVSRNENGAYSVSLDPIRVELDDAKSRYHIIKRNGRTKGIITNIIRRSNPQGDRGGMAIYAYLPSFDLFARIIRVDANSFGRKMTPGTQVMVRVIDHNDSGYLICEAMYDHGNNSMFNSYLYR